MRPADLFGQARRLAAASPKRPRDVDLRRAVSAAYYGLFHTLAHAGSDLLVGKTHRTEKAWRQVYRALQHGELKSRCEALPAGFAPHFVDIADTVVELQKLRHEADYDPTAVFRRADVQSHILKAETSVAAFTASAAAEQRAFVVWLLFPNRR